MSFIRHTNFDMVFAMCLGSCRRLLADPEVLARNSHRTSSHQCILVGLGKRRQDNQQVQFASRNQEARAMVAGHVRCLELFHPQLPI